MWIVIASTEGTRKVPEGVPYRLLPGERVIGAAEDETETELKAELDKQGIQWGDFVESVVQLIPEKIRPEHCTKCEKTKQALNHVRENGVLKTVKDVVKIRFGKD